MGHAVTLVPVLYSVEISRGVSGPEFRVLLGGAVSCRSMC